MLRVLTAKATQRVLYQLQELDLYKAQWFNNYVAANSPSQGDKVRREGSTSFAGPLQGCGWHRRLAARGTYQPAAQGGGGRASWRWLAAAHHAVRGCMHAPHLRDDSACLANSLVVRGSGCSPAALAGGPRLEGPRISPLNQPPCPVPVQFLLELFKQPPTEVFDPSTGTTHKIDPANLANRIIELRGSMAQGLLKFPK